MQLKRELKKTNVQLAWKLYNYVNKWDKQIFGNKTLNNSAYMFVLTLIAMYESLSMSDLVDLSGISYKETYRYMDSLLRHFCLINLENGSYSLSKKFIDSINRDNTKLDNINEQVFATVINNMKYHVRIFSENLSIDEEQRKYKLMKSLLNPVISNPIHSTYCRDLSKLGYMKFIQGTRELKLNKLAYLKDWVGTRVI